MQWHYELNGERRGPVDEDEVRELLAGGKLTRTSYVWNASCGDHWVRLGEVPELVRRPRLRLVSTRKPTATGVMPDGTREGDADPLAMLRDSRRVDYFMGHMRDRLDQGTSRRRIRDELVSQNVPVEVVDELLARVVRRRNWDVRRGAAAHLVAGLVCLGIAGGLVKYFPDMLEGNIAATIFLCAVVIGGALQLTSGSLRLAFGSVRRFVSVPLLLAATAGAAALLLRHFGYL